VHGAPETFSGQPRVTKRDGRITLERLFTHPGAFNVTTATPIQRALCRVAEGLPLGDLETHEAVVRAFGGVEAVRMLVPLVGIIPTEIYLVAAIRCGKSLFTAARAVHAALTMDLDAVPGLTAGAIARVAVVSLDKDKAGAVMQHLREAFGIDETGGASKTRPGGLVLARFLVKKPKPTTERLLLRRADGRLVEIVIAAGRRGGANLVSRWTIVVIFDEAARMLGEEDGVVNLDHARAAVIERIRVVGGQLLAVTSPWAARGPIYDAVQENWGKPTRHLVVLRATGPEMNPAIWTPEACEASRTAPNSSYENDVLGEFVDPEGGWLSASEVRAATRGRGPIGAPGHGVVCTCDECDVARIERVFEGQVDYTAAMDPGVSGNAWTLVVVGKRANDEGDETRDRYFIACARQWQGRADAPLKARAVFAEMAPLLATYHLSDVFSDKWAGALMAEIGEYGGVTVNVSRDTPEETSKNHANFRTLLLDERLELAPHPVLLADLLSKRKKLMPSGAITYPAPVTRDGRHADFADAAVLAVARASGGPSWVGAVGRWRARGGT
jgi:hypothetical protein